MIYGSGSNAAITFAINSGIIGATECTGFARFITPASVTQVPLVRQDGAFTPLQIGGGNFVNIAAWPSGSIMVRYAWTVAGSKSYAHTGRFKSGIGADSRLFVDNTVYASGFGSNYGGSGSGAITSAGSLFPLLCVEDLTDNATGYYLSDVAIWTVSLTDNEVSSLEKGFSPRRVRPSALIVHVPLVRNIQDVKRGLLPITAQGVTPALHPRYYP